MDKNNAFKLLGLPQDANANANANADAIAKAYRQRTADLKLQLNDAPSNMKGIYENNIREVEDAFRLLSSSASEWLPSTERVATPAAAAAAAASADAAAQKQGLMHAVNKWLFAVALVGFGAAAFFGMKWKDTDKELSEFVGEGNLKTLKKSLQGGTFKIVNNGKTAISLTDFSVAYLENGVMKSYQQEYTDAEIKEIKPGGNFEPVTQNNDLALPVKAFFYTIIIWDESGDNYRVLSGSYDDTPIPIFPDFFSKKLQ